MHLEHRVKLLRRIDEHAVERLERAVTSAPDSVPAQLGLAWAYLKMRQFGPCVRQAVKVLEKAPENARAHAIVGVALMRIGFLPEAAGSFDAALRSDSGEVLAIAGRAELDLYVGNLAESLRRSRDAVARSPRAPDFLYLLGQTAPRQARSEAAADGYERFLGVAAESGSDRRSRIRGLISLYRRLNVRNLYQVKGPKSVDVPMVLSDSRLPTVDVMLNGKGPFRFVIDSGAGFVVVGVGRGAATVVGVALAGMHTVSPGSSRVRAVALFASSISWVSTPTLPAMRLHESPRTTVYFLWHTGAGLGVVAGACVVAGAAAVGALSLIHISEPTRPY